MNKSQRSGDNMTGPNIDELEKGMNASPIAYVRPNGETVLQPLNFKFKVGQKVQHTAFGYNAIIMRRFYIEDADSNANSYDLAIWETSPPLEAQCVAEIYLKEGFRIE